MAEVAATLAFSTIENNDKVGVIFFSDKIEKYIPPKKGKTHVLHIIRELIGFEPSSHGTDIAGALEYFANAQKRRCTAFLISDMLLKSKVEAIEQPLMIASTRHDMNVIEVYDRYDMELPDMGLVKLHDAETHTDLWVDTTVSRVREAYNRTRRQWQDALSALWLKTGVSATAVRTDEDYVQALMKLFKDKRSNLRRPA